MFVVTAFLILLTNSLYADVEIHLYPFKIAFE